MPTSKTGHKPIKILYCIDRLVRGGTELQLIGLIERLDKTQYEPYLLTLRSTESELVPECCTHLNWDVPSLLSRRGLTAILRLRRWLKREQIDIVQTYFQDATVFGGMGARLAAVPVRIACFRDMAFWSNRRQALLMQLACSQMTGYIANADVVLQHFGRLLKIDTDKGRVIGNGVDVDALPYVRHEGVAKHVGIVGNMTREVKRTDLFIEAAGKLSTDFPDVTWHIIGDGHLRPDMERLANRLGIAENVRFTGRIDDVAEYLKNLDIGVICSDSEGLSNAIIEYMFRGVATVATSVGGNVELVEHDKTGLLVQPDNASALSDAIRTLIDKTEYRIRLTDGARKKAVQQYSWARCLESHDEFYRQQLGEPTCGVCNAVR